MDIAMVDDRPEDLGRLEALLRQYAAMNGLIFRLDSYDSGEALLRNYRPHRYGVIFLDVYMSGMTGIEAAARIRKQDDDTCLVFLTASDEHQAEAIHHHVYDYINKDGAPETVWQVMDRILHRHTAHRARRLKFVGKAVPKQGEADGMDRTEYSLAYDDIVYISAERNYLTIHDRLGNAYRARMTFSSVEEQLGADDRFLKLLRGVLVNMDYITDVSTNTCLLLEDIRLPVNVKNSAKIEQIWTNYTFSRIRRESAEEGFGL